MVSSRRLTPTQRDHLVEGYRLAATRLGELVDQRGTLLVFLRHYG